MTAQEPIEWRGITLLPHGPGVWLSADRLWKVTNIGGEPHWVAYLQLGTLSPRTVDLELLAAASGTTAVEALDTLVGPATAFAAKLNEALSKADDAKSPGLFESSIPQSDLDRAQPVTEEQIRAAHEQGRQDRRAVERTTTGRETRLAHVEAVQAHIALLEEVDRAVLAVKRSLEARNALVLLGPLMRLCAIQRIVLDTARNGDEAALLREILENRLPALDPLGEKTTQPLSNEEDRPPLERLEWKDHKGREATLYEYLDLRDALVFALKTQWGTHDVMVPLSVVAELHDLTGRWLRKLR